MSKKSVSIYIVGETIYFKPNANFKGMQIMMASTLSCLTNEVSSKIAQTLIDSFDYCKSVEDKPNSNNFKDFIKLTKAKSHIGLIRKAKFVMASNNDGNINLLRVEPNYKYKAYCVESDIPPESYNITDKELTKLGDKIRIVSSLTE